MVDDDYIVPQPSGSPPGTTIGVRGINLSRDLRAERDALADELGQLVERETQMHAA